MPPRSLVRRSLPAVAGLALLSAVFGSLDLRAHEIARVVALVALATVPAGDLLLRAAGVGGLTRGERFALTLGVGYVASSALYYLLSVAGLGAGFPPALLLAAGGAAWVRLKRPAEEPEAGRSWDLVLPVVIGAALLVTLRGSQAFTSVAGGLAYDHHPDYLFHDAVVWELLRGVPPREVPLSAGQPFPPYHVLGYMLPAFLVKWGGLGVPTALHGVVPVVHLGLLAGGVWVALRTRTGDARLALAAVAAVFFVGNVLEALFRDRLVTGRVPLEFFSRSVSGGAGVAVWALVFALLGLSERARLRGQPHRGSLYLAAGLAGVSYLFKAQLFLLLGGAFLLALAIAFLRDRGREAPLAAALTLGLAVLAWASWRSDASLAEVSWRPGVFAEEHVFPALAADPLRPIRGILFWGLQRQAWGWVLATALGVWRLLNLSPLVLAFVARQGLRIGRLGLTDTVLALAPLVAFGMACGLAGSPITGPGHLVREALYALPVLATVIDVGVVAALAARLGLPAGRATLGVVLVLALALAPAAIDHSTHESDGAQLVLDADEQAALFYLRQSTPLDSVVLSARTRSLPDLDSRYAGWDRYGVVAGLAGRRAVLEYYAHGPWFGERDKHKRRIFSTTDEATALHLLDKYDVDYVLEYAGLPLQFRTARLTPCHRGGRVAVWGVRGCPAPAGPTYAGESLR